MKRITSLALSLMFLAFFHGASRPGARADEVDIDIAPVVPEADAPAQSGCVGRLKLNSTRRAGEAPYTLVDKWGVIQCFVVPPPGVKLDRFINQRVKLRGPSRLLPNERVRAIDAEELTSADGRVVQLEPSRAQRPAGDVRQVSHQEEIIPPESGDDDLAPSPPGRGGAAPQATGEQRGWPEWDGGGEEYFDEPGCPTCGHYNPNCPICRCCEVGPPNRTWVRGEYLVWWTSGLRLPPLVTTGPSTAQPGFLDSQGTIILFGGDRVNDEARSGGRITFGHWLDCGRTVGLEGEYFALAQGHAGFFRSSTGNPILSRPFFDLRPDLVNQNVEQIASPGSISGSVDIGTLTRLQSAGARARFNLCCDAGCPNPCGPEFGGRDGFRVDLLAGYRFLRLDDRVAIVENLTSTSTTLPAGTFLVRDSFATENQFHGTEFGALFQFFRGSWSLEILSKMAMGNNREEVVINGSTDITQNGVTTPHVGGLLALPTNIGKFTRDEFTVVPELGSTLGCQLTRRLRATMGYSFIYWSRVARAGDQIDLDVNSTLLPNSPTPPAGDVRHPAFAFRDTDFWAQGFSWGLDYRW